MIGVLLFTVSAQGSGIAAPANADTNVTARPWQPFEVAMTAQAPMANPYSDGLPENGKPYARVIFVGTEGAARGMRLVVPAFWDGERAWRARFSPPAAGAWSYTTDSSDPGLRRTQGAFICSAWSPEEQAANPIRHGFVRVCRRGERPGRHFEYSDATPFLWIGDTWWGWARKGVSFDLFRQVVDDRAAKGFTVGQLFFGANNGTMLLGRNYNKPDLDQIRTAEEMVAYANGKGITVWIHPWWSARELSQRVGAEKIRRWTRYVVHRLAAYNVIWTVAGEYNMYDYGGMGLQFWKDLGELVRREDPYHHVIGIHNTPPGWDAGDMGDSAQWSTGEVLHTERWLDFNQSQPGHGRWRNERVPEIVAADYARRPAKPIVVTETWYEFANGSAPAADVRFAAWSAFLSGAAGHTYGGGDQWWALKRDRSRPMSPAHQGGGGWPYDEGDVDTLNYPGAVSVGWMARFLKGIAWWRLSPHPELVREYAARYCAAVPGQDYVVYVRWGGALKLDLRPSSDSDRFQYEWVDLASRKQYPTGEVSGGAIRAFHTPLDYPGVWQHDDWMLHVWRGNGPEAPEGVPTRTRR